MPTAISNTFEAAVTGVRAFPNAQGFGTETTHGRGGVVYIVDSLADTNTGSQVAPFAYKGTLRYALQATVPRIIIFELSGTIPISRIELIGDNSNVFVAGQTAPGDGICLRSTDGKELITASRTVGPTNPFHDGVFQHIRFRHSAQWVGGDTTATSATDNMSLRSGTYNVVFDHCSFTWHGDEAFSIYGGSGGNYELPMSIRDITISRSIIGEGAITSTDHNYGPLFSGLLRVNQDEYNIMCHHNLLLHSSIRNFRFLGGSGANDRGMYGINNVHYNNYNQEYGFAQNQYTGDSANWSDIIGDYFKAGPNDPSGNTPFTISRPGPTPPGGTFWPVQLYASGCTWRLQDGSPHPQNNEANNYAPGWINDQYGTETWVERASPMTTQPINAVTIDTFQEAYNSIVINGDVGALPHDPVDARLASDPETGGSYSMANVGPPWGSASYPTLSTATFYGGDPAKPVLDTSGNGLPDYFQTAAPISRLATDNYNPANTFSFGNGYSDIENWIHSL